jgi:hypothetical protein
MHTLWVRRQPPSSINELKSSRPPGHFGKPLLKCAALRRNPFWGSDVSHAILDFSGRQQLFSDTLAQRTILRIELPKKQAVSRSRLRLSR